MNLTEKIVRDTEPGPKMKIVWDRQVRGFGLRITPAGARAYILNYRVGGRERRATIGRPSEMSLKAARERAGDLLAGVRDGDDPLARRQEARQAPTFADLWQRFETEFAPERIALGRMKKRTLAEYRQQARRYLLPAFGRRRVADLSRADVERLARDLADRPAMRNRTLALVSRLSTLAEHWGMRPQHSNPARGIVRAREEPRDRTLSDTELAALGEALTDLASDHPAPVAAIRLCAMTGMRIGEVLSVRWQDIDFEASRVTLPATKAGRQVRAVPQAALALLDALPRINGCDWVISGNGRAPVGYKHARTVFAGACARAGIEDARLHDLRRTVATNAAASGIGLTVLRDVLGHRTTAMATRYARMADAAVAAAVEDTGGAIAAALGRAQD